MGGHVGQTLNEVLSDKYCFDMVYCFEPMPAQYNYLKENYKNSNLTILNYGLLDEQGDKIIYGSNNDMAASIFENKVDIDNKGYRTLCSFVRTADFFSQNIATDDLVIMKLNCEGSEIKIINDLIDTNEIWKVKNMMIDFDIRKVPGREYEAPFVLRKLSSINFTNFSLVDDVMIGYTHENRIGNWLSTLPFYNEILNKEIING